MIAGAHPLAERTKRVAQRGRGGRARGECGHVEQHGAWVGGAGAHAHAVSVEKIPMQQ